MAGCKLLDPLRMNPDLVRITTTPSRSLAAVNAVYPLRARIIGITGKAGAGKDTLANMLAQRHGYVVRPLASPMKEMLNKRFGWTMRDWDDRAWKETPHPSYGVKKDRHNTKTVVLGAGDVFSPRSWAQWLGTEVGREIGRDVWLDLWSRNWIKEKMPPTIIPDVRFDNEAVFVQNLQGLVLNVTRPGVEGVNPHASEAGISSGLVNWTVVNSGTPQDLYERARFFLEN